MVNKLNFLQAALKIITLHTFFLSTLMALGMFLSDRKNAKNQIFFGLYLSFSLLIFYFFLFESDTIKTYPYLSVVCLSSLFLIGPMVYFLVIYSTNNQFTLSKYEYRHFIPAVSAIFAGLCFAEIGGNIAHSVYRDFYENRFILILGFMGDISFTVYLILSGKKLIAKYLWNLMTLKNEPAAMASMLIFIILMLAGPTDVLTMLTGNYLFMQISILLVSVTVIILFILTLVYPNFEKVISTIVEKEHEKKSYLSNIDRHQLKNKLATLLNTDEIYKDEKLSLEKMAVKAGVSPHQLSEFINTQYEKNYPLFINEFRIEKAQTLLIEKPEFTILAIAYEVGFKSKSSFNDAFLKITGTTPSQFKKNHQ